MPAGLGEVLSKRASREIKMEVRHFLFALFVILVRSPTFQPQFEMMLEMTIQKNNCRSLMLDFVLEKRRLIFDKTLFTNKILDLIKTLVIVT